MRGKLRDKRTEKRDVFKRDVIERKRTSKRDTSPQTWLDQSEDDDELLMEEEGEETLVKVPQQKQTRDKK